MIQMRVRKQQEVDAVRIEAERFGIFLDQFTPALVHTAIDQDALTRAFNQVTGTGDTLVGPVERYFHMKPFTVVWHRRDQLASAGLPESTNREMLLHLALLWSVLDQYLIVPGSRLIAST